MHVNEESRLRHRFAKVEDCLLTYHFGDPVAVDRAQQESMNRVTNAVDAGLVSPLVAPSLKALIQEWDVLGHVKMEIAA